MQTKILFICHGNICRSPMAEFMMKELVEESGLTDKIYVASAATSTETIYNGCGEPVYPPAQKILAKHGIDCKNKRSQQVKKSDYQNYDFLVTMDSYNVRNTLRIIGEDPENKVFRLLDLTPKPRDIADPWYTGDFQQTWDDIEEGLPFLLEKAQELLFKH